MQNLLSNIKIQINPRIFVKDPETSTLGKKIVQFSILLIDEIGFDSFTFKKLGELIGSNESSIYRYFENKHKLLIYLSSWYWTWIEYKLVFATTNIQNPKDKLKKAITIVTQKIEDDLTTEHINESVLNKIIILEFTKTIHTKEVDEENKEGYFLIYKSVINRIVEMVNEVNPDYKYAKSLVSSIVQGNLHQIFLSEHLKTITDNHNKVAQNNFYVDLVERVLEKK